MTWPKEDMECYLQIVKILIDEYIKLKWFKKTNREYAQSNHAQDNEQLENRKQGEIC